MWSVDNRKHTHKQLSMVVENSASYSYHARVQRIRCLKINFIVIFIAIVVVMAIAMTTMGDGEFNSLRTGNIREEFSIGGYGCTESQECKSTDVDDVVRPPNDAAVP